MNPAAAAAETAGLLGTGALLALFMLFAGRNELKPAAVDVSRWSGERADE